MMHLVAGDVEGQNLRGMKPEDFMLHMTGLSEKDQRRYRALWERTNSETGAEEERKARLANKELEKQLVSVGFLKRDQFNRISGKYEIMHNNAYNEFLDYVDTLGPLSPKEMKDEATKFAIAKKKNEVFVPDTEPKMKVNLNKETKTDLEKDRGPNPLQGKILLGDKTYREWAAELKVKLERPPSMKEVNEYANKQMKLKKGQ